MTPVRVGLVGTGKFAAHHAAVWRTIPSVRLIGVHGADRQRLDDFAHRTGLQAVAAYEELVGGADLIDVVSVNQTHADYAMRAIERGKAVLIEKPIDVDVDKAQALCALAEARGILGAVVSQLRFQQGFLAIKRLLTQHALGEVDTSWVCACWPRPQEYFAASGGWRASAGRAGGGALLQQGIHLIDLLHWWFGEVTEVAGWDDETTPESVERSFWGQLRFANGVRCQLYVTTRQLAADGAWMEVWGARERVGSDGHRVSGARLRLRPAEWLARIGARLRRPETTSQLLRRQCLDVLNALERGTKPTVTLRDGLRALITAKALYEAARQGRRVALAASEELVHRG